MASAIPILDSRALLDGELLRAFAAFAETLSFTRAAKRIGLSQPALFERVRRLSDAVGRPLYVRESRELVLTEEGKEVAAFARELLSRAVEFGARLEGTTVERPVVLAAGEGSFVYLLAPVLRGARVAIEPRVLGGPDAADAVRTGEADLALGVFDVVPRGLVAHDVITTPLCAALARSHALTRRRTLRLSDLAGERPILAPEGQRHRELVSRAFASHGTGPLAPIEADGWPLMLAYAAAGLGVAIVNGTCHPPRGVVLRPIPELGTVTYRLLQRREVRAPEVTKVAARVRSLAGR